VVHEIETEKIKPYTMKKNLTLRDLIALIAAIAPVIYLAVIWQKIPAIVNTHYNINFEADAQGSRNQILLVSGILAIISLGVYFLLKFIHRIDPKRVDKDNTGRFEKIGLVATVFMAILNFIIIESAASNTLLMKKALVPLMGIMFAFLGNYMHTLKPNYFAGLRLPWTLSSETNWKMTHQLVGKLWFGGGLAIALLSILFPYKAGMFIFIAVMTIITIIPCIYSYRLYKSHIHNNNVG
jgi:uncharacterized membrane protein